MIDWITLGIAVFGAALSAILAIHKILFEERRKVKVRLEAGFVYHTLPAGVIIRGGKTTTSGGGSITIYTLSVNFYNKGKRPITITNYGIWLPNGNHIPNYKLAEIANHKLPYSYSDGDGDNFIGDRTSIESSIKDAGLNGTIKIRGYAEDISGKKHFSRKSKITIS